MVTELLAVTFIKVNKSTIRLISPNVLYKVQVNCKVSNVLGEGQLFREINMFEYCNDYQNHKTGNFRFILYT